MKYSGHNLAVIRKGMRVFIPSLEQKYIMRLFTNVSKAVFEWIDNHPSYYKDRTFNLRDSIGVGIYKEGVLLDWIHQPSEKATEGKKFKYKNYKTIVYGRELLNEAITGGNYSDIATYALVLYATAPYGLFVELGGPSGGNKGVNWWSEGLIPMVEDKFRQEIKAIEIKAKTKSFDVL